MPKLKADHISPTPEESAAIDAAAKADPDTVYFETDEEMDAFFARAVPYKAFMARRNKTAISIRLDADIIEHFKATGRGWQGRINDVLKAAIQEAPPMLHEPATKPFRHQGK